MIKRNQKIKRTIASTISLLITAQTMNGIFAYAAQDTPYKCGVLDITYTVTSEWDSSQNIQLCISNPTDLPVYRWAFKYDAGGTISDIWNADVVESSETEYTITNKDYNNYIAPHSSQVIGYTVEYNETDPEITGFTNCVENISLDSGFEIESNVANDEPESQNGIITIINTSEEPLYGWEISFCSDIELDNCYDATLVNNGDDSYTISCSEWNSIIFPGNTLELGVSADFNGNTAFRLDDISLTADVISYSFEPVSDAPLKLKGFSEYGINVLSWDYSNDALFDIYRKSNEEFSCIGNTENNMYYFDTDAEPGVSYEYYVVAESSEEVKSDTVTIETSDAPDDELTEEPQWFIDMMLLEEDFSELNIGYAEGNSRTYVSKQLELPVTGNNGSKISWKSSNPRIISESGYVNAPYSESFTPVTITALLSNGKFKMTKSFELSVAPKSRIEDVGELTYEDLAALNGGEIPSITYSAANDNVSKIEGICSSIPVFNSESAFSVLDSLSNLLGITEPETQIEFLNYQKSPANNVFIFHQLYKGLPVIGYNISLFADPETGTVKRINNQFHPQLELATITPEITADKAASIASAEFKAEVTDGPVLVVFYVFTEDEISKPVLAWKLSTDSFDASNVYIDAITGDVLEANGAQASTAQSSTYTEKNTLLGKTVTVNTEKKFRSLVKPYSNYYLHDTRRGIRVYNAEKKLEAKDWIEYIRHDNDWSDEEFDTAVAAEYNVAKAYDYFSNAYDWTGYDNCGGKNEMMIGINCAEKKKDGTINYKVSNAFSSNDKLYFGSGDGISTRSFASSLDCVAHEFTHSVTYNHFTPAFGENIKHEGESGAISEAYSDIFGEFVDPKYDWLHGVEYSLKDVPERDLTNPPVKYYHGLGWHDTSDAYKNSLFYDDGGVHTNCMVISYVAYLMTKPDEMTASAGIPKQILEKIWFESYSHYDNRCPTFLQCREAVEEAVNDLYGSDSEYAQKVRYAFDTVGIKYSAITVRVEDALTGDVVKDADVTFTSPFYLYNHSGTTTKFSRTDSHGEARFSDVLNNDTLTFEIKHSSYETLTSTIKAETLTSYYTFQLETPYTNKLKGIVTIADSDTDMTNNPPLEECNVRLEKLTGDGKIDGENNYMTVVTDKDGNYQFNNIPSGRFELTFRKDGYITTKQTLTIKNAVTKHNVAIEIMPDSLSGGGFASGTITDARTGATVSGLTLNIYHGIHVDSEEPSDDYWFADTLTTDEKGEYHTNELPAGSYTVFVIDERNGIDDSERYLKTSFTIKVSGYDLIAEQNGIVSQTLEANQLRVVLTWGSVPADLDLHALIYSKNGSQISHVSFYNREYYIGDEIATDLDYDDMYSYGPETITVYIPGNNRYVFYVHDYTNGLLGMENKELASSGARVYVYAGNSNMPIAVFSVPQENGSLWKVFEYNAANYEIITYDDSKKTISSYF